MQHPDGKPGLYYVTARDRGKTAFLLGPFVQSQPGTRAHRQALGAVGTCRRHVRAVGFTDAAFATFGTARLELDHPIPPAGHFGRVRCETRDA